MGLFDITADDIASLNDEDLRALVARLSEAEVRKRGISAVGVTWGGSQTAADAGLDVRVALPGGTPIEGFIPRPDTGFQVKKPDMPRSDILKEMRPGDMLRPSIADLAAKAGAYIIVSATGSTSDSALASRRAAMVEALNDAPAASSLLVDFYDRTRVATWVRDHAGLIPWVRARIGRHIPGWRPYEAWAHPAEGLAGEYLIDDAVRLQTGRKDDAGGLSARTGLARLRDTLRVAGKVVRLVGLSGVGKTRFVQALFDTRIGENALDPTLAIYTNLADGPDPQPVGLLSDLIAARSRAILIIDNCPPELHRRLADVCRVPESTVSVITVEYDIREDEPEGTDVFELAPCSRELIEKLVRKRYPTVSSVDSRTVAEFSGGNARIAMALASTIGKSETISGLADEELFQRLFQQRRGPSDDLLKAAQACALVYSFDGEALEGDTAEFPRLAGLIGKTAHDVFAQIAELYSRDLVQKRGPWRAVLPHAIANRLAALALRNIPAATIQAQLLNHGPPRLVKSFSRRLGYLHDCDEAVRLVTAWLSSNGMLADARLLTDLEKEMFGNVAPVAPAAVLAVLERAAAMPDGLEVISTTSLIRTVRSIAYDTAHFARCCRLLAAIASHLGKPSYHNRGNQAEEGLISLFHAFLSGTHAPIEARLSMIDEFLRSPHTDWRVFGFKALKAALETEHFMAHEAFSFGARSRDHGYWPGTRAQISAWYSAVLGFVTPRAMADTEEGASLRTLFADKFRGLWNRTGLEDELERMVRAVAAERFWPEAWIAVRFTLQYPPKDAPLAWAAQLKSLEKDLRAKNLAEKIRSLVLSKGMASLNLDDLEEDGTPDIPTTLKRRAEIAEELGEELARDPTVLAAVIPDLTKAEGRLYWLGRGLARGAKDPVAAWQQLADQLVATPEGERNAIVLHGFLNMVHASDSALADRLLDQAVEHEVLGAYTLGFEAAIPIGPRGVARLRRALALGRAPVRAYRVLGWGRSSHTIGGKDLKDMLLALAEKPGGADVAGEIIHMHLFVTKDDARVIDPESFAAGREFLRRYVFFKETGEGDYRHGELVRDCLAGDEGATVAAEIVRKLKAAIGSYDTHAFNHRHLLTALFETQPVVVLDALFAGDDQNRKNGLDLLDDFDDEDREFPMSAVPDDVLVA